MIEADASISVLKALLRHIVNRRPTTNIKAEFELGATKEEGKRIENEGYTPCKEQDQAPVDGKQVAVCFRDLAKWSPKGIVRGT